MGVDAWFSCFPLHLSIPDAYDISNSLFLYDLIAKIWLDLSIEQDFLGVQFQNEDQNLPRIWIQTLIRTQPTF